MQDCWDACAAAAALRNMRLNFSEFHREPAQGVPRYHVGGTVIAQVVLKNVQHRVTPASVLVEGDPLSQLPPWPREHVSRINVPRQNGEGQPAKPGRGGRDTVELF